MDPNTQVPDLQAATGQTPQVPMTGPSMLAALGSMQGPAPGLAAGSGMLSALAGRPGANPYLQQHAVAQEGFQRQIDSVRLAQQHDQSSLLHMQQLQERMREHALKRDDATRTILKDLLFGTHAIEDENVRRPFVDQYSKSMSGLGIPVPDSMKAVWTKGGPSQASQKNLAIQLASADAELEPNSKGLLEAQAQKYYLDHGGKPEDWGVVSQNLRSDTFLKSVNLPTKLDLRKESLDIQEKESKAIQAKYPELTKGKPEVIQDMIMQHRKFNNGQAYSEGTPESQQLAYSIAKYNEAAREGNQLKAQEEMRARLQASSQEFQSMMQDRRFQQQQKLQNERLAAQQQSVAKQKADAAQSTMETAINQLEESVKAMEKSGYLPKGKGFIDQKWAQVQRGFNPEDPAIRRFQEKQANLIGFARTFQNEIGFRAASMMEQTNNLVTRPPSMESWNEIFADMREQMKASRTNQVFPGRPMGQAAPGAAASPVNPKLPAGTKMENGELVSESGKYIWRNGAWVAR